MMERLKNRLVRVTLLTFNEEPIETVEGRLTSVGDLNIDFSSTMRRTCSFTMSLASKYTPYLWALKSKIKVELCVDDDWRTEGIFGLSTFNVNRTTSDITLQIQGKDKMAFLNGEFGGHFRSETRLDTIDEYDESTEKYVSTKISVKEIITNLLCLYAGEQRNNLYLSGLDDLSYELIKYNGLETLYMLRKKNDTSEVTQILSGDIKCIVTRSQLKFSDGNVLKTKVDETSSNIFIIGENANLDSLNSYYVNDYSTGESVYFEEDLLEQCEYYVQKISTDSIIGYRSTITSYPDELTMKAGDTIVAALNKITDAFPTFEYYYDEEGHFVFKKKDMYTSAIQKLTTNKGEVTYSFIDTSRINNITNNPDIANVKNDFIVWGKKVTNAGAEVPIHSRVAVIDKPTSYITYSGKLLSVGDVVSSSSGKIRTWRRLLYDIAEDYFAYGQNSNFEAVLNRNNRWCVNGKTGYESFYEDMISFYFLDEQHLVTMEDDWLDGGSEPIFWIDFLEPIGELQNYSMRIIGDRTKVTNDDKIRSLRKIEIAQIQFGDEKMTTTDGYRNFNLPDSMNNTGYVTIASYTKNAEEILDDLINENLLCNEKITLTAIPNYDLNVGERIYLNLKEVEAEGEYLITNLTIPLSFDGLMSITADKIIDEVV